MYEAQVEQLQTELKNKQKQIEQFKAKMDAN